MWGLAASVLSFSQARTASEEEEVLGFERELCKAYRDGDIAGITRGVTENYTLTDSHANVTGRAEDLEEARKGDPKYEIFENLGMKARVHGDTAVVIGRTHLKGTSDGKAFEKEVQFTDTLVRENGQWRLFAGHVSVKPEH